MHLFTEYALSTGSKINRPKLLEKFYPLQTQKYITFQGGSGMAGKNYDYFQEVFTLIKPILIKEGIDIVQLGVKDEPALPGAINLCGITNLAQTTYIIHRGLLHVGTDSSLVHIASVLDKPIVALYGISPPNVCGPYFNQNSQVICLEPEFPEGQKYSYNPNEQPKMVNTIKPEYVVNAIQDLLVLPIGIGIESLYFGKDYKKHLIELIPDHIPHPSNFPNIILSIRADLYWNENHIFGNLMHRPCILVINQPLNINLIKQYKPNINNILYLLELKNKERDLPFIKQLHEAGVSYVLLTNDLENINQFKFDYLDFNPIIYYPINKKIDIKNHEKIGDNTYFQTNKLILSEGKVYKSIAHWEAKIVYDSNQKNKIIDTEKFWWDLEYMYLFND